VGCDGPDPDSGPTGARVRLEQLGEGDEREHACRRHAEQVALLAEAAWSGLRGPDQVDWFGRLDTEHDNVRAALSWATRRDATLARRSAAHAGWFWWLRSHAAEGESWLRAALAAPGTAPQTLTARARVMLALLLAERVEAGVEEKAAREALADAQVAGGEPLASARLTLASTLGRRGDFDQAFELLARVEAEGDQWVGAVADLIRATLLSILDRTALRTVAACAVERFTAIGDRWDELDPRMQLAIDAEQHGDTDTAYQHYERCLHISRQPGLRAYEAMFITHFGNLALRTGDLDRAEEFLAQAASTFLRVGSPLGAAFSRSALAAVAARRGTSPGPGRSIRTYSPTSKAAARTSPPPRSPDSASWPCGRATSPRRRPAVRTALRPPPMRDTRQRSPSRSKASPEPLPLVGTPPAPTSSTRSTGPGRTSDPPTSRPPTRRASR
jgi:tetratricopeptide (TPR) repeat protein